MERLLLVVVVVAVLGVNIFFFTHLSIEFFFRLQTGKRKNTHFEVEFEKDFISFRTAFRISL